MLLVYEKGARDTPGDGINIIPLEMELTLTNPPLYRYLEAFLGLPFLAGFIMCFELVQVVAYTHGQQMAMVSWD